MFSATLLEIHLNDTKIYYPNPIPIIQGVLWMEVIPFSSVEMDENDYGR